MTRCMAPEKENISKTTLIHKQGDRVYEKEVFTF